MSYQPLISPPQRTSSGAAFSRLHGVVSSDLSFLNKEVDLASSPIGADLSGHDAYGGSGPFPVLITPCIREVLDIDTVTQRATILLDVCMDWVGIHAWLQQGWLSKQINHSSYRYCVLPAVD
jgi:hypothetical protein